MHSKCGEGVEPSTVGFFTKMSADMRPYSGSSTTDLSLSAFYRFGYRIQFGCR